MKRIPKTVVAAAFLAAFAVGQEPRQDEQTPQDPNYAQPETPVGPPTYVQPSQQDPVPHPQHPVVQPTEPAPPVTEPAAPTVTVTVDRPLEIIDLSTIPDVGPTIKDWAPTPPGEMNPRTGIVEPNWNNIGTGIPDYSKPYDPDEDPEVQEMKRKKHEKCGRNLDRHSDTQWKYCPEHSWDW